MSSILDTYARKPISFSKGKGSYLFTEKGEKYLDFVQGIATNVLGHCHNHLVKTIQEQSKKLWHVSNAFVIPEQERLAKRLTKNTFADFVCFQIQEQRQPKQALRLLENIFIKLVNLKKIELLLLKELFMEEL